MSTRSLKPFNQQSNLNFLYWSCQLFSLCLSFFTFGSSSQINSTCLTRHDSTNKVLLVRGMRPRFGCSLSLKHSTASRCFWHLCFIVSVRSAAWFALPVSLYVSAVFSPSIWCLSAVVFLPLNFCIFSPTTVSVFVFLFLHKEATISEN